MAMACVSAWILPRHVQPLTLLISAVGMDCPYQIKSINERFYPLVPANMLFLVLPPLAALKIISELQV